MKLIILKISIYYNCIYIGIHYVYIICNKYLGKKLRVFIKVLSLRRTIDNIFVRQQKNHSSFFTSSYTNLNFKFLYKLDT